MICWALIGGTFAAFVQPARDALLNRVAGDEIQRVVVLAIGVQFGVQIVGFALGSSAAYLGPPVLLILMALFMLSAGLATFLIPPLPQNRRPPVGSPVALILDGIRFAWQHDWIRPAILQTFAVGIFFAGAFMVLLPLMVRDLYAGSSVHIAATFAANMIGTVVVVYVLMRTGRIRRPGRLLLISSMISAVVLASLFIELPLWGFYVVVFLWGMCGGIGMTMSRSIVQEAAVASHRARVMSVYALGLMGGMPLGSLTLGAIVDWIGVRNAALVPALGMLCVLVYLVLRTQLWRAESGSELTQPMDPKHV